MATPTTRDEILELLRKSGVLKAEVLQKFLDEHPDMPGEAKAVAALFVQAKLLTTFQAKLLLAGRYRGFRLGAYILLEQLGQGGMGAVYLAEHDTLHRKAAIKVLPPGGDKITVERFLREARAAAALDHPNIVRMHDVGREGDVHFLVMEYVEGQTLDKLVTSSAPLPAVKAVEYIAQACAGLQHACERGFIHRDIKPANLILSKDGTIKILDMGLARSNEKQDQLTENLDAGAIVGTADYISPEQAINDSGVDIRTDIYSLGATFFAIVTGRPPFDGPTASKLVQHQVKEPPSVSTLDRTFPKGLSSVIAKMMAKKPADRYATPAEVVEALQPWQNESAKLMAGLSQTLAGQTGSLNKRTGTLNPPEIPKKKGRGVMFAVLGGMAAAAVLGIGISVVLALTGGGSQSKSKPGSTESTSAIPDTVPTITETTKPTSAPVTTPKTIPPTTNRNNVTPPDPPIRLKNLFTFDAETIPDFTVVKEWHNSVKGKDGKFPTGIYGQSPKAGTQAEFRSEEYAGKRAITMFSASGMPSGQFVFDLEEGLKIPLQPDKRYSVTIVYAVAGSGSGVFIAAGPGPKYQKLAGASLSPTQGKYETTTISFVRAPGMPVRASFTVHTTGIENAIHIHRLEVAEDSTPAPKPVPKRVVYSLDLANYKPVVVTVKTNANDSKTHREVKRVPMGAPFPGGWYTRSNLPDVACESEIVQVDGTWAFGFRTSALPPASTKVGTALLFSPRFECPGGIARLKFEYKTAIPADKVSIKLKIGTTQATQLARLTTPTTGWKAFDQVLDLNKASQASIEITANGELGETFWIRRFAVSEADPSELK